MENGFASISPVEFWQALQIVLAAGLNVLSFAEDRDGCAIDCLPFEPGELDERTKTALGLLSGEDPDALLSMFRLYDTMVNGLADIHNTSRIERLSDLVCGPCGGDGEESHSPGFEESVNENKKFFIGGAVRGIQVVGDISDPQVSVHLQDGDGEDFYARFVLTEVSDEPLDDGDAVIRTLV